jgi:small subunit ribosomal protein S16
VVAYVGSYNPHTKEVKLDTEKIEFYLKNGSQPTPRVAKILKENKVKLPEWVVFKNSKTATTKNVEKLRKNQPAPVETPEEPATEAAQTEAVAEAPTE